MKEKRHREGERGREEGVQGAPTCREILSRVANPKPSTPNLKT